MQDRTEQSEPVVQRAMRRLLLMVVTIGMVGTAADLLLLEHYEEAWQLPPLVLIAFGLLVVAWLFVSTAACRDRHEGLDGLLRCDGMIGILLHYSGNSEFQREIDPTIQGWALIQAVRSEGAAGAGPGHHDPAWPARASLHVSPSGSGRRGPDEPPKGATRMKTKFERSLSSLSCWLDSAHAQVGKSLGVVDANTAAEKDLLGMPHMNAARVKGLIEKRPFASITDLNAYLLSQKLTPSRRWMSTPRRSSTSI